MQPSLLRFFLAAVASTILLSSSAQAQAPQQSATQRTTIPKNVGYITPHPPYPLEARLDGVQGRGVLEVTFSAQGDVTKAVMVKSTGSSILDLAATSNAKARWKNLTGKPKVLQINLAFRLPRYP